MIKETVMVSGYYTGEPTITQVVLRKLQSRLESRRDRRMAVRENNPSIPAFVRLFLTLAGFVCCTIAAFSLTIVAGFAVAGISCFVLAWLATPSTSGSGDKSTIDRR
jgi:hypothetical protein